MTLKRRRRYMYIKTYYIYNNKLKDLFLTIRKIIEGNREKTHEKQSNTKGTNSHTKRETKEFVVWILNKNFYKIDIIFFNHF